jgi:class 3 adenylate cyclase/tetratricopeptide (TPR) repeat protein
MPLPPPLSFLSLTLRERLAAREPLTGPEVLEEEGVVLLTDIQGFSMMVNQFTQRGRAGLENLTWAMNGYFADLAEIVHRHAGDVIAIAGDSFLCLWRAGGDLSINEASARAGQAALSIQAALHNRQASSGMRFRTRIGLGSGPLSVAFVGGVQGKWECLLGGLAHQEAVRAESMAEPGDVVLSPRTAHAIESLGNLIWAADDYARLTSIMVHTPPLLGQPTEVDPERLIPCVPSAIVHRIGLPSPEWLAELRHVSLFLTTLPPLDGVSEKLHEQLEHTHRVIVAFQKVVLSYGGTAKVDIDAKGNLLYGLWGLPPQAHEDDALRAVEATRALRESAPSGECLAIGIASGKVLCGAFGSESRREYVVRGEAINIAARLMQAADRNILCDQATMMATRERMAYEELPPMKVKGRPDPVPVVRPFGRRVSSVSKPSSMIGRVREHQLLRSALDALIDSRQGSTWLIQAEAGLGKSVLVQSLALEALSRGARVLQGAADSIDRDAAFGVWRGVFSTILDGEDERAMRETLHERLLDLPDVARLAPLASAVVPIELADTSLTEEIRGEARADGTKRLLHALLRQAMEQAPTVLIVEDLHWADTLSRALLKEICEHHPASLLVLTTRPGNAEGDFILSSIDEASIIRLDRLYDDEIDRIVCHEIGVRNVPRMLLKWIRSRVNGHPYFAAELVRALRSSNAFDVNEGRCSVHNLDAINLPATIEGVITQRLDRLSPEQQLTLKVAAVIGRVFGERTVRDTHPDREAEVASHLTTFLEHAITAPIASPSRQTYEFCHVLVRDVAYEQMPQLQRKMLHRGVAGWLEREHKERLSPVAANLAEHWERAEDDERAMTFLELAGEHSLRAGAYAEAANHFNKALAIAARVSGHASSERRSRWLIGLGQAAYFLGDLNKSRSLLEEAVGELDRPLPKTDTATLLALAQQIFQQALNRMVRMGSHSFSLKSGGQSKRVLAATTDSYGILCQIFFLKGEPTTRLAYLTVRSVNVGERAGKSVSLAKALVRMGTLMSLLGCKKWSDWYGTRAVAMAEQEEQFAAGAYVCHVEALRLIANGCAEEALASNAIALERIVALGDFNLELEAMSVRAMIATTCGRFELAAPAAQRCVELARKSGSMSLGGWALLNLMEGALARDDLPGAQTFLAEGRALLVGLKDVPSIVLLACAEAQLAQYEGRWDDALRSARSVVASIGKQAPTAYYLANAFATACHIVLAGMATDQAVSEREIRSYSRRLAILAKTFWNVRSKSEQFDRMMLKRIRSKASP